MITKNEKEILKLIIKDFQTKEITSYSISYFYTKENGKEQYIQEDSKE